MSHNAAKSRTGRQSRSTNRRPKANGHRPKAKQSNRFRNNFDHYLELARSAAMSGDEVTAEGHYQHAEHYLRLMNAGAN